MMQRQHQVRAPVMTTAAEQSTWTSGQQFTFAAALVHLMIWVSRRQVLLHGNMKGRQASSKAPAKTIATSSTGSGR